MEPLLQNNKRCYEHHIFGVKKSLIIIHLLEAAILINLIIGLLTV
jgi:hypothetical protein